MIKTLKKITIASVAIALLIGSFLLGSVICEPCRNHNDYCKSSFTSASTKKDFSIEDVTLSFYDGNSDSAIATGGSSPYFTYYNDEPKTFMAKDEQAGLTLDAFKTAVANDPETANRSMFVDIAWGATVNADAIFAGVEYLTGQKDVPDNVSLGFDQYWICGVVKLDKSIYNEPIIQSTGDPYDPTCDSITDANNYVVRFYQKWGIKPREVNLVVKDQKTDSLGQAPDLSPSKVIDIIDNKTGKKIENITLSDVIPDLLGVSTKVEGNELKVSYDATKVSKNYVIVVAKNGNYAVIVDFMMWIPSIALGGLALIFLIIFLALFKSIKKYKA